MFCFETVFTFQNFKKFAFFKWGCQEERVLYIKKIYFFTLQSSQVVSPKDKDAVTLACERSQAAGDQCGVATLQVRLFLDIETRGLQIRKQSLVWTD